MTHFDAAGEPNDDFNGRLTKANIPVSPETLLAAYRQGLVVGYSSNGLGRWYSPPLRIISETPFRVSAADRRLVAELSEKYVITLNCSFDQVLEACSRAQLHRVNRSGSPVDRGNNSIAVPGWMTDDLLHSYRALHRYGVAHSVEIWMQDGTLIAGLFGIHTSGLFVGEAAFTHEEEAWRLAVLAFGQHLASQRVRYVDTQELIPMTDDWSGVPVSRRAFGEILHQSRLEDASFGDAAPRRLVLDAFLVD